MSAPELIITTHEPSGVALVRGAEAEQATRAVATERRWSREARGWVIPLGDVGDLLAYAAYFHLFAISNPLKKAS